MAEVLLTYDVPIASQEGTAYRARACGAPAEGGLWQGWIEFVPLSGGTVLRSGRETTQPNRADAEYWATGLTPTYLEGALARARNPRRVRPVSIEPPPFYDVPAPDRVEPEPPAVASPMDPFSAYQKGEAFLRRQLDALAAWHLVNIVRAHGLSEQDPAALERLSHSGLEELIVSGVRRKMAGETLP
jgi:hypothetical protein